MITRHLFFTAILTCFFTPFIYAQGNVAINTTGTPAHASAILDIQSDTSGLLIPRMMTISKLAINAPATGLLVFDLDTESLWCYTGNGWVETIAGFPTQMMDADADTKLEVEQTPDADAIHMTVGGNEAMWLDGKTVHIESPGNSLMIGSEAGAADDGTNNQNTFIGIQAGKINADGGNNTALGYLALSQNTSGHENTVIGHTAGNFNISGDQNTVIGKEANLLNQTGSKNTILGYQAGRNTGPGSFGNIFLGYRAGYSETGNNKLYIENSNLGNPLIYGEFDNDILGINGRLGVGTTNPLARLNVDSDPGEDAFRARVAGATKFMVHDNGGVSVGANFTPPIDGLYITGELDGQSNGYFAGAVGVGTATPDSRMNVSASAGETAFRVRIDGSTELAVNSNRGTSVGSSATGPANGLYVNGRTGLGVTSPTDKLHIKSASGEDALRIQVGNSTKFRVYDNGGVSFFANTTPTANGIFMELGAVDLEIRPSSNEFDIVPTEWGFGEVGDSNFPFHEMHSNTFFGVLAPPSDRRYKENIRPIFDPVQLLKSLDGKMYAFKEEYYYRGNRQKDEFKRTHQLGLIAQEVEKILPQLVHTDADTGMKSVEYTGVIPILIEVVKQQQETIEMLQSEYSALHARIQELPR